MRHLTDTSFLIGDGTGRGSADAKYFVFESDEYERHFKPYYPDYSIITNIDYDHPDYFKSLEDVCDAFEDYAHQVKKGLIVYGEDPHLRQLTATVPIYYYGCSEDNDYVVHTIDRSTTGSTFKLRFGQEDLGDFRVPTFGQHNIMNAAAVIATLHQAGFEMELVREHLVTFKGVKRRFTEKTINDTVIIDDFAHHPTEIIATIDAARQKYPGREIVAIFQPHTFTRTIALLDDFAEALNVSDRVYLAQIYSSTRETDKGQVKVEDLASKVDKLGTVITVEDVSPLLDHSNAVYVFMGAGDIQSYEYAFERLLSQLSKNVQ